MYTLNLKDNEWGVCGIVAVMRALHNPKKDSVFFSLQILSIFVWAVCVSVCRGKKESRFVSPFPSVKIKYAEHLNANRTPILNAAHKFCMIWPC